ncbi:alpha/beta hydrolase [Brevibacterium album]|uniref:alpha/beta hydrolase n=1 Tax=Brevibacterium album TaxID=417948 RepID=UPI0004285FD2|nr:alpha/beta hydrolase [Brevibacterium album]
MDSPADAPGPQSPASPAPAERAGTAGDRAASEAGGGGAAGHREDGDWQEARGWHEDILGPDFAALTLPLPAPPVFEDAGPAGAPAPAGEAGDTPEAGGPAKGEAAREGAAASASSGARNATAAGDDRAGASPAREDRQATLVAHRPRPAAAAVRAPAARTAPAYRPGPAVQPQPAGADQSMRAGAGARGRTGASAVRDPAALDPAAARDAWRPLFPDMEPGLLDDVVVLHLHGWSDYFFHANLARFWTALGAHFYALDLHGYGRNLDPARMERSVYARGRHQPDPETLQRPGFTTDLSDYDADLEAALTVIAEESPGRRLVLSAHSTGGLIAALWADRNPGRVHGLALNSPWLEFQFSTAIRRLLQPVFARGRAATAALPLHMPNHYVMATSAALGRLPYDMRLKPPESFPVYAGWMRAIFAGHRAVEEGLDIAAPVLVQTSSRSLRKMSYDQEMEGTDIVLDVEAIARRAVHLAPTVVLDRVPGAMHDLFLSHREAQAHAFAGLLRFARGYLAKGPEAGA